MFNKVRDIGNKTAMASDLRSRLAVAILFSRLLALFFSLLLSISLVVDVVMPGSSLKRCLRFWDSMEESNRKMEPELVYDKVGISGGGLYRRERVLGDKFIWEVGKGVTSTGGWRKW